MTLMSIAVKMGEEESIGTLYDFSLVNFHVITTIFVVNFHVITMIFALQFISSIGED